MAFTNEIAVLRIPGPNGIIHQWAGPLRTITTDNVLDKITISVRVSMAQRLNITFLNRSFLQVRHPQVRHPLYLYNPAIPPSAMLSQRLEDQLRRNNLWRLATSASTLISRLQDRRSFL